jgi:AraC family transcriptional regulator of adaptative response/methylated-DNA-[protein]-cysteine methyltransferase
LIEMEQTAMFTPMLERPRPMPPRGEMEQAFLNSDARYDGVFYTAVKSTGIFCRPSCRARKPRPENVEFFDVVRNALKAGYRPCLRCRPLEADGRGPDWVGKLLAAVEQSPTHHLAAADLQELGIDPARARRHFQKTYGMSFQEYCRGRRMGQALHVIRQGGTVDDAVFESGYESHSGFREGFSRTFGQTPGRSRAAAPDSVQLAWLPTPLGQVVAGAIEGGICLLEFTDGAENTAGVFSRRLRRPVVPGDTPWHQQLGRELKEYFAAQRKQFSVPLVLLGSEFEQSVWRELLRIPYGETRSYEEMARRIGNLRAVRAVGRANGRNLVSIVIPCHRVINKNGGLGGYGGGLWRKRLLLHLERTGEPIG